MEFDADGFQLNPMTGKRFSYKEPLNAERFFSSYRVRKDGRSVGTFRTEEQFRKVRKDKSGPARSFATVKNQLYWDAKDRAEKKGIAFDLTADWVSGQLQHAIESGQVVLGTQGSGQANPRAPSIDRIVPRLGYIQANCRIIPLQLNMAKGVWDEESFLNVLGPEVDRLREVKRQRMDVHNQ